MTWDMAMLASIVMWIMGLAGGKFLRWHWNGPSFITAFVLVPFATGVVSFVAPPMLPTGLQQMWFVFAGIMITLAFMHGWVMGMPKMHALPQATLSSGS